MHPGGRGRRPGLRIVPGLAAVSTHDRTAKAYDAFSDVRWWGLSIAVVDNVMTRGNTLAEIARLLKAAGAAQAWVFARTPGPGDE